MRTDATANSTGPKAARGAKLTAPLIAVEPVESVKRRKRAKAEVLAPTPAPIALPFPVGPIAASKHSSRPTSAVRASGCAGGGEKKGLFTVKNPY